MHTKQMTAVLAALLLCAATAAPAAVNKDKDETPGDRGQNTGTHGNDPIIIIRNKAEKKQRQQQEAAGRDNDNSNRQSDPDSERGLERAQERRAEQADEHSQAGGKADKPDEGWYEYLFGKRREDGDKPDKKDDGSRWWWPF